MIGDILRERLVGSVSVRPRRSLLARIIEMDAGYRQRQVLKGLSDEHLEDIGLTRADVDRKPETPFRDPPIQLR